MPPMASSGVAIAKNLVGLWRATISKNAAALDSVYGCGNASRKLSHTLRLFAYFTRAAWSWLLHERIAPNEVRINIAFTLQCNAPTFNRTKGPRRELVAHRTFSPTLSPKTGEKGGASDLGAQGGLGYIIRCARVRLETDAILAAIMLLAFCLFAGSGHRVYFWAPASLGA